MVDILQFVGGGLIILYWIGILGSLNSAPEGNFWRTAAHILGWPRPLWLYLHGEWTSRTLTSELRSGQELGLYK